LDGITEEQRGGPNQLFALEMDATRALIGLRTETLDRSRAVPELERIESQLAVQGQWQHLRSHAFRSAVALDDRARLIELYFGSPFSHLRERISRLLGPDSIPLEHEWRLEGEASSAKTRPVRVDVASGEVTDHGILKTGQLMHRTLA